MKRMIASNFRDFVLLALTLLLVMLGLEWRKLWQHMDWRSLQGALLAGTSFTVLYFLWLQNHVQFWKTFFHELTHVLFAILFLNKVINFQATMRSGGVIHYQGRNNWVISLSPYFFPIHTVALMLLTAIVQPSWVLYVHMLVAASYAFFLLTQRRDLGFHQSDLRKSGLVFSSLILVELNVLFLLILVFFLQGNLADLLQITSHASQHWWRVVRHVL